MEIIKCPHCGKEVLSSSDSCFHCGGKITYVEPKPKAPTYPTFTQSPTQSTFEATEQIEETIEDTSSSQTATTNTDSASNPLPMKWYKFLKVILWFGIISNIFSAFSYFSGNIYQGFADKIYDMLPSLKALDIVMGLYCIAMVILAIVAWNALKNYKKSAPKLVPTLYLVGAIFTAIYTFAFYGIIGGAETTIIYGSSYIQGMYQYQEYLDLSQVALSATDIISIALSFLLAWANFVYFKKRAHLFDK